MFVQKKKPQKNRVYVTVNGRRKKSQKKVGERTPLYFFLGFFASPISFTRYSGWALNLWWCSTNKLKNLAHIEKVFQQKQAQKTEKNGKKSLFKYFPRPIVPQTARIRVLWKARVWALRFGIFFFEKLCHHFFLKKIAWFFIQKTNFIIFFKKIFFKKISKNFSPHMAAKTPKK